MRKEKEKEFFAEHLETFRAHGIADPTFVINTAYFVKGKAERQFQLFASEITKELDIYIEFYDNVKDEANDKAPCCQSTRLRRNINVSGSQGAT
jgi:hypothetical protein